MLLKTSLRTCDAQETLETILPYLSRAGITRLANLTNLDESCVPVYTAIRPLSKSLSTSQGKSMHHIDAIVSAYMENLEIYFAEQTKPDLINKSFNDNENINFINPNSISKNIIYDLKQKYNWCKVKEFIEDCEYYIPYQFLSIDTTDRNVLIEATDSTGIASGNSYEEALLHSLLECIERQATKLKPQEIQIDIKNEVYECLQKTNLVKVCYYPNQFNISVYGCFIQSKNKLENQIIFSGYGAHLDKDIALNRALTEALQSKVTTISGSRDDIHKYVYIESNETLKIKKDGLLFSQLPSIETQSVSTAVETLKNILQKLNLNALVHIYHQESLTFLKSFIIENEILSK